MSDDRWSAGILDWIRRRERALAAGYLVVVAIVVLAFAAAPVRARALESLESGLRWWDARWTSRIVEADRLVAAGRWDEAVAYLERLDRAHPATSMRHVREREREHLLALLGRAYEAQGRNTRAIETYQRLAAFDPRHYRNTFELAEASHRLLSGALMAQEARDAYAAVLQIHPVHLPSLRGYITYYTDHGDFRPVVAAYGAYLDAHLVQLVEVRLGDAKATLDVLVDGRMRDYEIPLASSLTSSSLTGTDTLTIATGGFPAAIERVEIVPATRVGRAVTFPPAGLDLGSAELVAFERGEGGVLVPTGADSALRLSGAAKTTQRAIERGAHLSAGSVTPSAASGVRLRLALYKPIDRPLWSKIVKSYGNVLDDVGLAAARQRTVPLATPEAADLVLSRTGWAIEGRLVFQRQ